MQRILATRQRVVKIFALLKSNALFNAFLREEGGTRMRDGRSLRDPRFFACFITTAFPKLRTLPQSPTATAPSRREPFTKHILPLSLVYFSLPAIASFEPRHYGGVFVLQKTGSLAKRTPFLFTLSCAVPAPEPHRYWKRSAPLQACHKSLLFS